MALDVALHFSKLDIFAQSEIDQSPNTFYQFRFDKNQNASAVVGANLKRSTSTSAIELLEKMAKTIEKEMEMKNEGVKQMEMKDEVVKEVEMKTENEEEKKSDDNSIIMYNNRNILDLSYLCTKKTHLYGHAILNPECELSKKYNNYNQQESIEKEVVSSSSMN